MNTTAHHDIAIVGAGLGGLTAARVLHINGIEAAVFEREASREVRTQGGMLDIHVENGQHALRDADLFEAFRGIVHSGGESVRVLDQHGVVLHEELDDGSFARPEVDRGELRDLLLDSLPAGTVRWGSKVTRIGERTPEGSYPVTLESGDRYTADVIIGADGAWSKIRGFVTAARPVYVGISFLEADLKDADERHPAEAAVMGTGMLFALGGSTGILGHRETDGSLHYYLAHRAPEGWIDTIKWSDEVVGKQAALALLEGWAPELRGLVANADTGLTPRAIYALPPDLTWERVPGITLLGDAAHLMSPFAGEGANLAMYDGALLGLGLAENLADVEAALTKYEGELFERAHASARESAEGLAALFCDDAATKLADMFKSFAREEPERREGPGPSYP